MSDIEHKVDTVLAIEKEFNNLAVPIRQIASIVKVSGQMCSEIFKRRLGFSFTVIIV